MAAGRIADQCGNGAHYWEGCPNIENICSYQTVYFNIRDNICLSASRYFTFVSYAEFVSFVASTVCDKFVAIIFPKKVRSIWICMDHDETEDSIEEISLERKTVFGSKKNSYPADLMKGIIVNLFQSLYHHRCCR